MQYYIHFIQKLNSLIYIFTFEAGNLIINDGPLVKAMENGKVFITDEFNLAEDTILQTINIALEPADENSMFLIPDTKIKRIMYFSLQHVKMIYQHQEEKDYQI